MKQTVFRKVMVKDRLPVSFGEYITDIGYMFYNNGQKYFEDRQGVGFPKWFLEEIKLPSEEEIRSEADEHSWFADWSAEENIAHNTGFNVGANYILSKLK